MISRIIETMIQRFPAACTETPEAVRDYNDGSPGKSTRVTVPELRPCRRGGIVRGTDARAMEP